MTVFNRNTAFALGFTMLAGFASAQPVSPSADHSPSMPAVQTSTTVSTQMPAAGRNSFTKKQAMKHLQDKGYSSISGLMKDNSGVWRGTAMRDGAKHNVGLDYQGNISEE